MCKEEIEKIKVVLVALWNNQNFPEATSIIEEFERELKKGRSKNIIKNIKRNLI